MDLTNKKTLIETLKRHNLWAKKRFGQNFLISRNVLETIVKTGEISREDHIVEVGAGLGTLTIELEKYAGKVTAIEADKTLIPILEEHIQKAEIIQGDALKLPPPKTKYKVIANIPYQITSPLLTHFLTAKNSPEKIVFLIQKEVAEKICAKEGHLNVLAITVQAFGTPKIIEKVSNGCFYPSPKVESAIIEIKSLKDPLVSKEEFPEFIELVKKGFSQKRKKLINSLSNAAKIKTEILKSVFAELGMHENTRAQELGIKDWRTLLRKLKLARV